jgi:ATP sulfurylase
VLNVNFRHKKMNNSFMNIDEVPNLLIAPHGGKLIQNFLDVGFDIESRKLPRIKVDIETLLDVEQIAHGTYSPLTGFMNGEEIHSVLEQDRLLNGAAWTLPIILQINAEQLDKIGGSEEVILNDLNDKPHSLIKINDVFYFDLENHIKAWFGTSDDNHPGIKKVRNRGNRFLAGDVFLLDKKHFQNPEFSKPPEQIRRMMTEKGWTRSVGFHTRNVPHRAHEFIQIQALEQANADGLLISPVMGTKKSGDFVEQVIFDSYQIAIENSYFPKPKVIFSGFNTYSRYAGPREAVFTAICRKNMGCSHFIIGRDHTGVGNYYGPYASQQVFEKIGDIGIQPIFFPEIAYNSKTRLHEVVKKDEAYSKLSGTEVRKMLLCRELLPHWFIREKIQEYLIESIASGRKVFVE